MATNSRALVFGISSFSIMTSLTVLCALLHYWGKMKLISYALYDQVTSCNIYLPKKQSFVPYMCNNI